MRLYIAEKPSLARAIIDVLPKPHNKQDGYVVVGNGDIVSWCIGHLLELAEPQDYDASFAKWQLEHLPIVPTQWQFQAKSKTKKQLNCLIKLIKKADQIVHAGDPDREGQLLVDEVIDYAKATSEQKKAMARLLISDLNPQAVKRALDSLKSNQEFIPLSVSALARVRADWLYGINLTRLFTILGRQRGGGQVLSIGRVQTPVLGLVVKRDAEIAHFQSKPFYEVLAHVANEQSASFSAKWQPSEACEPYQDEEGRVLHRALAENVASRITQQQAQVNKVDKQQRKEQPPLPFNLSALQIEANKAFAMSAKTVLDVCQALYEKHKLITYPRSDSRYLPKEHYAQRFEVSAAIFNNVAESQYQSADLNLRSKCWNDEKVSAHHAIIPTARKVQLTNLSDFEQKIYKLIARQYIVQFFPAYQYQEVKVELNIAGGLFKASSKTQLVAGFKMLSDFQNKSSSAFLPELQVGDMLWCERGEVVEKHTQPPEHFTEATLLAAMTGVARFVQNPEIKRVLKETDGLGTEATRAGIIDLLFKRQFLQRSGKKVLSTALGQALIGAIPESLTLPDRTAIWESQLSLMAQKQHSYSAFMSALEGELSALVNASLQVDMANLQQCVPQKPIKARKWRAKKRSKVVSKA
ncbi:DNA topoisomerase III [Pseudoalteromonas fenneropenaei]|uniref:DNA topoisomerase 3 n=1 Tax=Pseudoalteromonas fenneropenaei TaxID=1737459 RepID=A0ABV7CII4_9GAMM